MEQEIKSSAYCLNEGNKTGSVKIADDVVAMIASLATSEVDGVSAMVGNITNELMGRVGMKKLTKGVKVEVIDKKVVVDLSIMLQYGFNIPQTSAKVQDKVKAAIENMTGLEVSHVNVHIAGINITEEQ